MDSENIHIYTYKARINNAQRFDFAKKKTKKKKGINGVQLRKISNALTGVLKTQIRKQGHVDTGKMVNGTKVIATIGARGVLVAKVFSKADYWKYVNGNFEILENAMKTRKWKQVEDQFNEYNQGHPKRN
jgi:superoxide dismutase